MFIIQFSEFPVYVYPEIDLIQSGGVEIRGLHANVIAKRKPLADPVLEKYMFVPNIIETVKLKCIINRSQLIFEIILYF